jgi:hypothetical protein
MSKSGRKQDREATGKSTAAERKGVKLGRIVPGPGHSPRVTDESWRTLVPPAVEARRRLTGSKTNP